ncbi:MULTISPECIES: D-amino-acid transaminase [Shouchella]|uniref:D-alanine aminotransferase n=1 Tax=Shouchella hunanensis TaxID=766894 RepID=A0ABY7W8X5_9BACI|nr:MULTISPECIES: D-amino-acid transaminase [Shouchella]WDF03973.1 D-amino-acid transaminase [Shouchella hunanensis]GAF22645.1 D-alanine aminotransferase [Bacillus sp. JCM 19047]
MTYVLYNDSILDENDVAISYKDRGYHFGDGVYEVIRVYNGQYFTLDEHLTRLYESAKKIELEIPHSFEAFKTLLHDYKETLKTENGSIYVQITRGASDRNHLYTKEEKPVILGFEVKGKSVDTKQEQGVAAYVTEDVRWLRCDIKSLNLLGNVMAKRKAFDHDCEEAILYRESGVTEGSSSNLFLVNNETLYTHPANNLILNGITRQEILAIAKELKIGVIEEPFPKEVLLHADEAFITSTSLEIVPVHTFKGDIEATISVGTVTKKLQQALKEHVQKKTNASV